MAPPPLHLFDLPIEILVQILHPLLVTGDGAPISICACAPAPLTHRSTVLAILLAHPRLHAIATPLLYGPDQTFLLDLTGDHHARVRRELDHDPLPGSLLASRDALGRVQRLVIRLDRLRGWMNARVVPIVADMILRGQLVRLDVVLATDEHLGLRYDAARLAPGTPLAGIVGLLADPDLRSAAMYVLAAHGREWCRFHAPSASGSCDGVVEHGVVELDWRAMVREADPAGARFPVSATGGRAPE